MAPKRVADGSPDGEEDMTKHVAPDTGGGR
jgi:hypothetical protein